MHHGNSAIGVIWKIPPNLDDILNSVKKECDISNFQQLGVMCQKSKQLASIYSSYGPLDYDIIHVFLLQYTENRHPDLPSFSTFFGYFFVATGNFPHWGKLIAL
jgi:hypothetical protein